MLYFRPPAPAVSPRLSSSRSQPWLAGMTVGASGALVGAANAEIVQITLSDNFMNMSLDSLQRDLTGDAIEDIEDWTRVVYTNKGTSRGRYISRNRLSLYSGSLRLARARGTYYVDLSSSTSSRTYNVAVGTNTSGGLSVSGDVTDFVEVEFTDSRINGGAKTMGYVEIRARNLSVSNQRIELIRLVFNDADTGPPVGAVAGGTDPEWVYTPPPVVTKETDNSKKIRLLEKRIRNWKRRIARLDKRSLLSSERRRREIEARREIRKLRLRIRALRA